MIGNGHIQAWIERDITLSRRNIIERDILRLGACTTSAENPYFEVDMLACSATVNVFLERLTVVEDALLGHLEVEPLLT